MKGVGRFGGRRIFATCMSFMIAVSGLTGCADQSLQTVGNGDGNEAAQTNGAGTDGSGQAAEGTAMGRYLEEVTDLSESLEGYRDQIFQMADGSMVITEPMQLMLSSKDRGVTWEPEADPWLQELLEQGVYIDHYAVGADGTIGIVYEYMEHKEAAGAEEGSTTDADTEKGSRTAADIEEDGGNETDTEIDERRNGAADIEEDGGNETDADIDEHRNGAADTEEDGGNETDADAGHGEMADADADIEEKTDSETDADTDGSSDDAELPWWALAQMEVLIVKPDGTQIPVAFTGTEKDMQPAHIWISEQGRIFVGTEGADLYEVAEDGSKKLFLTLEESPQLIQFQGSRMIIDGYDFDSLVIYDMERGVYVEDDVLADFIAENYGNRSFNGGSWCDLYFFSGEDNILYLAGEQGVHRHVIGGSAMEQIIDAKLTTFSNPEYRLLSMTALEDNEFMAIYTGGRLVRFRYDPTVPTVPGETVRAYSLQENNTLRRAIAVYQTAHPEVYVEYEIGMEPDSGITRDDALKKLNTKIMAGEGPDLLLLDGLPMDSYIEKGLLQDIAPLIREIGEEKLYARAVDAYRQAGRIYAVPCEISLPVIEGDPEVVSGIADLSGIADAVEQLRQMYPEEDLLNICSPKGVMKQFGMVCAPAWQTADGALDREKIAEFLTQTKRIYDAQMDGLPEEVVRRYEVQNEEYVQYDGVTMEDSEWFGCGTEEMGYVTGERRVMIGVCGGAYTYAEMNSVLRTEGFEDNVIMPLSGQCRDVFYVKTLAGVSATATQTGHAEGLLRVLLGDEDLSSNGFSLNRNAVESTLFTAEYTSSDDLCAEMMFGYEDGSSFTWRAYWYDEPQAEVLRQWLSDVRTPYVRGGMLEEAVYEAGAPYLLGETSLEEAVAAVEKKMAIYMSE